MKTLGLLVGIVLFVFMCGVGCSESPTQPPFSYGEFSTVEAQVHFDILKDINVRRGLGEAMMTREELVTLAMDVVNKKLLRENLSPFSRRRIEGLIELGATEAQKDPEALMKRHFGANVADYEWWKRWAEQATLDNAREVYVQHCQLYGEPEPESLLDTTIQMALSSAEIWGPYREGQKPVNTNVHVEALNKFNWHRFIRITVSVVVDVSTGAAAAVVSGGIAAGLGGSLCSLGADQWIYGGN